MFYFALFSQLNLTKTIKKQKVIRKLAVVRIRLSVSGRNLWQRWERRIVSRSLWWKGVQNEWRGLVLTLYHALFLQGAVWRIHIRRRRVGTTFNHLVRRHWGVLWHYFWNESTFYLISRWSKYRNNENRKRNSFSKIVSWKTSMRAFCIDWIHLFITKKTDWAIIVFKHKRFSVIWGDPNRDENTNENNQCHKNS